VPEELDIKNIYMIYRYQESLSDKNMNKTLRQKYRVTGKRPKMFVLINFEFVILPARQQVL
jgi:hypothetical protein